MPTQPNDFVLFDVFPDDAARPDALVREVLRQAAAARTPILQIHPASGAVAEFQAEESAVRATLLETTGDYVVVGVRRATEPQARTNCFAEVQKDTWAVLECRTPAQFVSVNELATALMTGHATEEIDPKCVINRRNEVLDTVVSLLRARPSTDEEHRRVVKSGLEFLQSVDAAIIAEGERAGRHGNGAG